MKLKFGTPTSETLKRVHLEKIIFTVSERQYFVIWYLLKFGLRNLALLPSKFITFLHSISVFLSRKYC